MAQDSNSNPDKSNSSEPTKTTEPTKSNEPTQEPSIVELSEKAGFKRVKSGKIFTIIGGVAERMPRPKR